MTAQPPGRDFGDLLAAGKLWLTAGRATSTGPVGDMPYLSTALYALFPVATTRVSRMTTDTMWRLYVNPDWLTDPARTIPEIGLELAHSVWHLLADHAGRAVDCRVAPATSRHWRVAADATIFQVVQSAGLTPAARPPARVAAARMAALGDEHTLVSAQALGLPGDRSAEEYFALLSGLPSPEDLEGPDWDPAWQARQPLDPAGSGDPSCGSGCDGLHRSFELPPDDQVGGLGAQAAESIREVVAIEFREHITSRGTDPGQWGRWISQVLDPVVDWRSVLHAAVRRGLGWAHGHSDYTYTRISRRQASSRDVVLPALRRPIPRVAVVVDTSGSVDDGLLAQALGEIDGVLGALGVADAQVNVLAVDAAVHTVTEVRKAAAIPLAGGGGTDLTVGITAAQELRPRVDVIIVITDGYTGWPDLPAPVPVVAVLLGRDRRQLPPTPDWVARVECVP